MDRRKFLKLGVAAPVAILVVPPLRLEDVAEVMADEVEFSIGDDLPHGAAKPRVDYDPITVKLTMYHNDVETYSSLHELPMAVQANVMKVMAGPGSLHIQADKEFWFDRITVACPPLSEYFEGNLDFDKRHCPMFVSKGGILTIQTDDNGLLVMQG